MLDRFGEVEATACTRRLLSSNAESGSMPTNWSSRSPLISAAVGHTLGPDGGELGADSCQLPRPR